MYLYFWHAGSDSLIVFESSVARLICRRTFRSAALNDWYCWVSMPGIVNWHQNPLNHNRPACVNTHTNDNNNRMCLTSSPRSAAEILQQPVLPCTAKYCDTLAATIIEWGGEYTENDVQDAHKKLEVLPRDTIRVREILTFWKLIGSPVGSHGLLHAFMFWNPSGVTGVLNPK